MKPTLFYMLNSYNNTLLNSNNTSAILTSNSIFQKDNNFPFGQDNSFFNKLLSHKEKSFTHDSKEIKQSRPLTKWQKTSKWELDKSDASAFIAPPKRIRRVKRFEGVTMEVLFESKGNKDQENSKQTNPTPSSIAHLNNLKDCQKLTVSTQYSLGNKRMLISSIYRDCLKKEEICTNLESIYQVDTSDGKNGKAELISVSTTQSICQDKKSSCVIL